MLLAKRKKSLRVFRFIWASTTFGMGKRNDNQIQWEQSVSCGYYCLLFFKRKSPPLRKPKKGWTLPGHNFTGPYNPLEKQVKYNPETGEILEIYQQPTGTTDAIAMQHDVDYDVCSNREKSMVKILKNAKTKRIKKW